MALPILGIIGTLVKPITDLLAKRQENRAADASAKAKLAQAQEEGSHTLSVNDQELERINAAVKKDSWLDEFVTVSLYALFYGIGAGSMLTAFGRPEMLEGILLAVRTLVEIGVDVGFLMEAVTLAAVGLVVWRKL